MAEDTCDVLSECTGVVARLRQQSFYTREHDTYYTLHEWEKATNPGKHSQVNLRLVLPVPVLHNGR